MESEKVFISGDPIEPISYEGDVKDIVEVQHMCTPARAAQDDIVLFVVGHDSDDIIGSRRRPHQHPEDLEPP